MWNRSDSKTITYENPPREISEEDFHKQQINNYLHNTTLLQFVCEFTVERRITLHIAIGLFGPSEGPGGPGAVPQQEGIVGVEGIGPQLLFYLRIGSHRLPIHAQLHLGGNNHFPGTEGAAVICLRQLLKIEKGRIAAAGRIGNGQVGISLAPGEVQVTLPVGRALAPGEADAVFLIGRTAQVADLVYPGSLLAGGGQQQGGKKQESCFHRPIPIIHPRPS